MEHAGLRGKRVDLLSVDVESAELEIFRTFPFADFDVRHVVVEVGSGVRWLEVDTIFLSNGFAKVAVLGRDAVYARLANLGARSWRALKEAVATRGKTGRDEGKESKDRRGR